MFGDSRPGAVSNPGPDAGDVLGRVGRHWGWIMAFGVINLLAPAVHVT